MSLVASFPLPLQTLAVRQPPKAGSAPRISRSVGLTATLLAHLLLLLFLFLRQDPLIQGQQGPAGLKTLSAVWIPAPNVAPKVTVAATPTPKLSPRPPTSKAKQQPQPPKPVADNRIAAVTPTPTISSTPTPAAPAADPAEAANAAATVAAAQAQVAASPPPVAGETSNVASTTSYVDLDRLERQYARLVSRTISFNQHYPVYSKQFGESGTVLVRVSLARDGTVLDAVVLTPTGYRYLDDEARNVMMRVGRFAQVPALLRQGSKVVVIDQPVKFELR